MAVLGTYTPVREAGNGSKVDFDFSFKVISASDLNVGKVLNSTNVKTTMTLGVDYTVAINPTTDGGTVTYMVAPTALQDSWIGRAVPATQATDIPTNSIFREVQVENALDKLTMVVQQQAEDIGRAIKVDELGSGVTPVLPAPEDGKILMWDGTSGTLKNVDNAGDPGPTGPQGPAGADGADGASYPNDGTVSPTNLLKNGSFETFSAGTSTDPDGWTAGAGATAREASIIKQGTYSVKLTKSAADASLGQLVTLGAYAASRAYTFSCWVYATVASRARLGVYDSRAGVWAYSPYHTGDSTWQLLTVSRIYSASAAAGDYLSANLLVDTGNTAAYFDGAMMVEGSSMFAFSPKPAEEGVAADYSAVSTIVGWSAFSTKKILVCKVGKVVTVNYAIVGTSDQITATFTLPYQIMSTLDVYWLGTSSDNGGADVVGRNVITTGSPSTVNLTKTIAGASWTSSGAKSCAGQFSYMTA